MIVLTVLLYILGILLALVLLLGLFIMVVPLRYRVQAGFQNQMCFSFNLRCSPALIFNGSWEENESKPLQAKFILFGIPVKIDPQKFKRKEKDEKEKGKEKKKGKNKGSQSLFLALDRDLQVRGISLVKELLRILKPDLFNLKGRIGFDEPHLTGWLAAVTHTLEYSSKEILVDLEPAWEDEYYEFEAFVKGRIMVGVILVKIGWFFLINRTGHLFSRPKKYETGSNEAVSNT